MGAHHRGSTPRQWRPPRSACVESPEPYPQTDGATPRLPPQRSRRQRHSAPRSHVCRPAPRVDAPPSPPHPPHAPDETPRWYTPAAAYPLVAEIPCSASPPCAIPAPPTTPPRQYARASAALAPNALPLVPILCNITKHATHSLADAIPIHPMCPQSYHDQIGPSSTHVPGPTSLSHDT